ncbi:MAG: Ig-like domain-containing protein [Pseudomonadota bacterium]
MISGTRRDDVLTGTNRADTLAGLGGDDTLTGRGKKDRLDGGAGSDALNGGGGKDTLDGGRGDDTLTGGGGKDTFVLSEGADRITDFSVSKDRLDLSQLDLTYAQVQAALDGATRVDGNLVITFDDATSLTLEGLRPRDVASLNLILPPKPDISGRLTRETDEDSDKTLKGRVRVEFDDGSKGDFAAVEPEALTGLFGTFSFNESNGRWRYTPDTSLTQALKDGETATETLTITDETGAATAEITVTLTGENDAATIGGDTRATLAAADEDTNVSGTLTILDPDAGEAAFKALSRSERTGDAGRFVFDETTGEWTYRLDTTSDAFSDLSDGESLTERLRVEGVDGTAQQNIRVTVTKDSETSLSDVAFIGESNGFLKTDPPSITLKAEAGAQLQINWGDGEGLTDAGTATGQTQTITKPTAYNEEGALTVVVVVTDPAGNSESATLETTLDASAPTAPTLTSITVDSGSSDSDFITADRTLVYLGTGEVGSAVRLFLNDSEVGVAAVGSTGQWQIDQRGVPLDEGSYTLRLEAFDAAANTTAAVNLPTLTIDTSDPAAPVITGMSDDTGTSDSDRVTSDATPTFTGTAESGAALQLLRDGAVVVSGTSTDGTFSLTVPEMLSDGQHTFTVRATDAAGNSSESAGFTITTDTSATIVGPDLRGSSDTGTSTTDNITSDTTPSFNYTIEAGSTVEVDWGQGAGFQSVGVATGALQTLTAPAAFGEGTFTVQLRATDIAGNTGTASLPITIDTTGPAAPTITSITSDTGSSETDFVTSDTTLIVFGTAQPGLVVSVFDDGVLLGTTTTATGGVWRLDISATNLSEGVRTLTATASDAAGNPSTAASQTLNIDTTAVISDITLTPTSDTGSSSTDGITAQTTPTIQVTAEAGAVLEVNWGDGLGFVAAGTGTGAAQQLTAPSPFASDGDFTVTVRSTDAAGNTASKLGTVTIDTTAPAAVGVTDATSPGGTLTFVTADTTPLLRGTAEPGATVTVSDGVNPAVTATANAGGSWSTPLDNGGAGFASGDTALTLQVTDAAGNAGPQTNLTLRIDLTATLENLALTSGSDTGLSTSDRITNDTTPTLSFDTEQGSTLEVDWGDGFGFIAAGTAASDSVTVTKPSAYGLDGSKTITVRSTDPVGNVKTESVAITLDTVAPGASFSGIAAQSTPVTIATSGSNTDERAEIARLSDDSGVIVRAVKTDSGGPTQNAIAVRIVDGSGATQGSELLLDLGNSGPANPSVVALTGGGFVVTWQSAASGGSNVLAQRFDANGDTVGGTISVDANSGTQSVPIVSALPNGGFVISYETSQLAATPFGQETRYAFFDAAGTKGASAGINLNTLNDQIDPSIAARAGGGAVAVYADEHVVNLAGGPSDDNDVSAIFLREITSGGSTGDTVQVNVTGTGFQGNPVIEPLSTGGFVVAWVDGSTSASSIGGNAIRYRLLTDDGTDVRPSGAEFVIPTIGFDMSNDKEPGFVPSVVAGPNGTFAIVWAEFERSNISGTNTLNFSDGTIRAQLFNADGSANGAAFEVGTTGNNNVFPSAVFLSSTELAIVYTDDDANAHRFQVFDVADPEATTFRLAASSDSGTSNSDRITNDTTPTMEVQTATGFGLEIDWKDGNGFIDHGVATGALQSITIPSAYTSDGTFAVELRVTDVAGNTATEAQNITIDTDAGVSGSFTTATNAGTETLSFTLTTQTDTTFDFLVAETINDAGTEFDFVQTPGVEISDSVIRNAASSDQFFLRIEDTAGNQEHLALSGAGDTFDF